MKNEYSLSIHWLVNLRRLRDKTPHSTSLLLLKNDRDKLTEITGQKLGANCIGTNYREPILYGTDCEGTNCNGTDCEGTNCNGTN